MSEPEPVVHVVEGLTLRPGDRVLLTLSGSTTPEQVEYMQAELTKRFPDVEFTFVADAHAIRIEGKQ